MLLPGSKHHIKVKVVKTRWYHKLLSKLHHPVKDMIPLSITLPLYVTYSGKFVVGNVIGRTRREDSCASSDSRHIH